MSSSKRYQLRFSALVVLFLVLCGVLTVGVSAYEPCQRAVKKVVQKVEWPHYSKATVARWVKWNKDHPNYVPPKRKPVVTQQETEEMLAFACDSPTIAAPDTEGFLLQPDADQVLGFVMADARPFTIELASSGTPPAAINVPVSTPVVTTVTGVTPEPGSWLLLATGLAGLGILLYRRSLSGEINLSADLLA